jgi:aminoglycoside phosphotransferase (APT) family kinase protein
MTDGAPAAEVDINGALVEQLLKSQAPQFSGQPITLIGEGWDNSLYRLGDSWLTRLPRRSVAVPLLENEQRVLKTLAKRLPVAVPAPVFCGQPSNDFPWPWSITPYIDGTTLDLAPLRRKGVIQWVDFLLALHQPHCLDDGLEPPVNAHRGVPLYRRAQGLEQRMEQLRESGVTIDSRLVDLWQQALAAPDSRRKFWLHGDPHPRNALGTGGLLSAVIDWGDVTAGDPASDLASLWMVAHVRDDRRDAWARYLRCQNGNLEPSELGALYLRSMGWAVVYGCIHLATGLVNHPAHAVIGQRTLQNLADDVSAFGDLPPIYT